MRTHQCCFRELPNPRAREPMGARCSMLLSLHDNAEPKRDGNISDAAFLLRFRSLHAPDDVAGDFHNDTPKHEYEEQRRRVGRVVFVLDFLPGMVDDPPSPQRGLLLMRRFESRPTGHTAALGDLPGLDRLRAPDSALPEGHRRADRLQRHLPLHRSIPRRWQLCGLSHRRPQLQGAVLVPPPQRPCLGSRHGARRLYIGQMGQMIIVGCAGGFFYSD
jgi:hypothetical protein